MAFSLNTGDLQSLQSGLAQLDSLQSFTPPDVISPLKDVKPPFVTEEPSTARGSVSSHSSVSTINKVARPIEIRSDTVSAFGGIAPVVYGRTRVGAKIFAWGLSGTDLILGCLWCHGEIDAVEAIRFDDQAMPGDVTATHYTGTTTQTADATLAATLTGYSDTLVISRGAYTFGLAYSVFRIPFVEGRRFPRIVATIRGRKVYDPRDVGQSENDSSTWLYSANPVLCAADFERNAVFGRGNDGKIDWASVDAAADAADATVGGSPRRTIGLEIDIEQTADAWAQVFRDYGGYFVLWSEGKINFVADRPAATSRSITAADILEGSFAIAKAGRRNVPTVMRVTYTDTTQEPWRDADAVAKASGVDEGTTPWIETALRLPGITNHAEAYRYAVERLNANTLQDLSAEWTTFDEGLQDLIGDIISVTHPIGLTSKLMRISSVNPISAGRWRIAAVEYDPAVYSDAVVSGATYPDTRLPHPNSIGAPTGLTAESGTNHLLLNSDGTITSRILFSWDSPTADFSPIYDIRWKRQEDTRYRWDTVIATETYLAPVQDGKIYDLEVRANIAGYRTAWASTTHTVIGKTAPPTAIPWARISGDYLQWGEISDVDLAGYLVRYQLGPYLSFSDANPLTDGPIRNNPFRLEDIAYLQNRQLTIMVAGVDTTGNIGDFAFVQTNYGQRITENVVETRAEHGLGWPGALTGGTIDGSNQLIADETTLFWSGDDGAAMWTTDSTLMWGAQLYAAMSYETTFTPTKLGKIFVDISAQGEPLKIEYGVSNVLMWGTETDLLWSGDANDMWQTVTYTPWLGAIDAVAGEYQFRVSTGAGSLRGIVSRLKFVIDVPDIVEMVEDLSIATAGTRLPIQRSYTAIKVVNVTLQDDGGTAVSAKVIDKNATQGPLVKVYNTSGAATTGLIDAIIQGY